MRLVTLAALLALVAAPAAGRAQEIPVFFVTMPAFVDLVGNSSGVPDPAGRFTVVVRDIANNVLPNAHVTVDFSGCSDLAICQDQADPALTVTCQSGASTVSALTDANGVATLDLMGHATASGGAPGPGLNCARVYVESTMVGSVTVTACDRVGGDGVHAGDMAAFLQDWGAGTYVGRVDLNHDGAFNAADLVVWLRRWGQGSSVGGCGTMPGGGGVCP
jgi:hypothetical protein